MSHTIGVRRETKSTWERRAPLTPPLVRRLVHDSGLQVVVQASARRVFPDKEYVHAGAAVSSDLSAARVVLGVKEIPPDLLQPDTTYLYFAHVIKGQPYNMAMLARLLELGCTLIDYELIRDDDGRRLVFFGRFAGLAGMIDSLSALGQRLDDEGFTTPLATIEPAHTYGSLDEAKAAVLAAGRTITSIGLPENVAPLVVGVAGYGNVASGVREILSELPLKTVEPDGLAELVATGNASRRHVYTTTFREEHLVVPRTPGHPFDLQEYYAHPELYAPSFWPHLPHLTVLMNCNYWDARYPRLVTTDDLRKLWGGGTPPRLRLIGDLGCDVDGAVQCTTHVTEPGNPVYVWDPTTGETTAGVSGNGPVVLAVDILPAELPRDASEAFAAALGHFVPAIAAADYTRPFTELDLPAEILRAVVVHRGELVPEWAHLAEHLQAR